jgi:hypothetical protein
VIRSVSELDIRRYASLTQPYGSRRSPMGRAVEPLVMLARLMGLPAHLGSISDPPSPAARERRPAKPRSPQRVFFDADAVAGIPRLMPSCSPPARTAAPRLSWPRTEPRSNNEPKSGVRICGVATAGRSQWKM